MLKSINENIKPLPFPDALLEEIAQTYGTPVFIYDEAGIRNNAKRINEAFSWSKNYVNYFAVKATPTPAILRIIHDEKMGFDCSSRGELEMLAQENLTCNGVFYTSNNTPDQDYVRANEMGATINIDKAQYLYQVKDALGALPKRMAIRFNPGKEKAGNAIIGEPQESKFGDTREKVIEALKEMKKFGVEEIGIHAMVSSNEKNPEYFGDTARLLKELSLLAKKTHNIDIAFINVGGGMGVNYHASEEAVDVQAIGDAVRMQLEELGIEVYTENGRYITGPHGFLLTRVTHGIIESHEPFVQIDSSINNMARLATVKAAYHHINVLGRDDDEKRKMHITGSLCANTDKMFKWHDLPSTIQPGDLMVIHDAGAHSRANSHNYNFRLRAGEVLVRQDGTHQLIRRHETLDDLFATTKGL
jgi:diaminopimelate decarboxylase